MADDVDISHRIGTLVDEERSLREQLAAGRIDRADEQARLGAIEV